VAHLKEWVRREDLLPKDLMIRMHLEEVRPRTSRKGWKSAKSGPKRSDSNWRSGSKQSHKTRREKHWKQTRPNVRKWIDKRNCLLEPETDLKAERLKKPQIYCSPPQLLCKIQLISKQRELLGPVWIGVYEMNMSLPILDKLHDKLKFNQ